MKKINFKEYAWVWPLLGSLVLWIVASLISHGVSFKLLFLNATLASFLALLGLGQMTVIASGDGSIDLSMPYVLTLSAYVSAAVMNGGNAHLIEGIALALAVSLAVGVLNGVMIAFLRIPAIITTLATGYIVYTVLLQISASKVGAYAASPGLQGFVHTQVDGLSAVVVLAVAAGVVLLWLVRSSVFGRRLLAMGQSRPAAKLAGIPVSRMMLMNFLVSALMGALSGLLLGAFDGGAFVNMGNAYLLTSIGAVVIGGTLISGGKASVVGTLGGALLLTLIVTVLELSKIAIGFQDVIEGLLLVVFVILSQGMRAQY